MFICNFFMYPFFTTTVMMVVDFRLWWQWLVGVVGGRMGWGEVKWSGHCRFKVKGGGNCKFEVVVIVIFAVAMVVGWDGVKSVCD